MAESVKFTEEEMNELKSLQQAYAGVQNALGGITVQRMRLENQTVELDGAEAQVKSQYSDNQKKEQDFVSKINAKYGDGNLDLNTGVFTPRPEEESTDKTL